VAKDLDSPIILICFVPSSNHYKTKLLLLN